MTGSGSGGPDSKEEKRLNEDLVVFMRKRSDVNASHYAPALKTYVTLQQKRRRAAAARQKVEHAHDKMSDKKQENDLKSKVPLSGENNVGENERKRRVIGDKNGGVRSRSRSEEQTDSACHRRRRRRSCGRRKRTCRRRRRSRRRRRRSCHRRHRSVRRRRSRSRRRRQCGKCRHRRRRRRC